MPKPYEAPQVVELGSVEELTMADKNVFHDDGTNLVVIPGVVVDIGTGPFPIIG
jgi:hypothetical protein